jgi:hypothetical protein
VILTRRATTPRGKNRHPNIVWWLRSDRHVAQTLEVRSSYHLRNWSPRHEDIWGSIRWRWVVSFKPLPIYSRGHSHRSPSDGIRSRGFELPATLSVRVLHPLALVSPAEPPWWFYHSWRLQAGRSFKFASQSQKEGEGGLERDCTAQRDITQTLAVTVPRQCPFVLLKKVHGEKVKHWNVKKELQQANQVK